MKSKSLAVEKIIETIHPATWWALGLAFVVWSSVSTNLLSLVCILAINIATIALFRGPAPWAQSLRFYLVTALLVIAIRLIFRIIFNFDASENIALHLPSIRLQLGALGDLQLFGSVGQTALVSALRDGLKMAAIILSIGMANSLANPRKLLKSTPSALHEVAAAFVIAINMAPQLISSAKRVRKFSKLRGRSQSQNRLTSIIVPTLEDTIEKSMALAASMDARGFGRRGSLTTAESRLSRLSSLTTVAAWGISIYFFLSGNDIWLACLWFAIGALSLVVTLRFARLGRIRTAYLRQKLGIADYPFLLTSIAIIYLSIGGFLK